MALANLLAFAVFTLWPCMRPRLLPASHGFVNMAHEHGKSSFWTTNRFCSPLAGLPSLHFGYSLIVGISLCAHPPPHRLTPLYLRAVFLLYPALILFAIFATANHYLLDALAGLFVAALARHANATLVPLIALENAIFYMLHVHKPSQAHLVEIRACRTLSRTSQRTPSNLQGMAPLGERLHRYVGLMVELTLGTTAWLVNF